MHLESTIQWVMYWIADPICWAPLGSNIEPIGSMKRRTTTYSWCWASLWSEIYSDNTHLTSARQPNEASFGDGEDKVRSRRNGTTPKARNSCNITWKKMQAFGTRHQREKRAKEGHSETMKEFSTRTYQKRKEHSEAHPSYPLATSMAQTHPCQEGI